MNKNIHISAHALRAAKEWCMPQAKLPVVDSLAQCIDQHAIAPAVAERDKRIAELEEALKPFARLASGGFVGTVWQDSWEQYRDSVEFSYDHANGNHTTLFDYRRAIEVLAKKGQP